MRWRTTSSTLLTGLCLAPIHNQAAVVGRATWTACALATALVAGCGPPGGVRGGDAGDGDQGGQGGGSGSGGADSGGRPDMAPDPAGCNAQGTFFGCRFYPIDSDNYKGTDGWPAGVLDNDREPYDLVVGNPDSTKTAKVLLQVKDGAVWKPYMSSVVAPGAMAVMQIKADRHLEGPGIGKGLAYRLLSDVPIVAYQYNSDDTNKRSTSTSGNVLLPAHVFGDRHLAMAMPQVTRSGERFSVAEAGRSLVAVVSPADGTRVTVEVSARAMGGGGMPALDAGGAFTTTLDEGDVLQIQSREDGDDLTGTSIESGGPVAVYAGSTCTQTEADDPWHVCDKVEEQMPSLRAWGKKFVAAYLEPPPPYKTERGKGCDLVLNATRWRILASEDGTTVSFESPAPVDGLPPSPIALERGQFRQLLTRGSCATCAPGAFVIKASKPVLVAQIIACEPSMVVVPPVEQLLEEFLFLTPTFYENDVRIVREAGMPVTLDGKTIADTMFLPAGAGFETARLALRDCGFDPKDCAHRIRAPGSIVAVYVRGQDGNCSYAFAGGVGVKCVNATAGCP